MKERIEAPKVDLDSYDTAELHMMAENLSEAIIRSEQELRRILDVITERTGLAFMGEDTDALELVDR